MTFFDDLIKCHHSDNMGFARHYMLLYSIVYGLEAKIAFEFGVGFSSQVIIKAMQDVNETSDYKLISCDVRAASHFSSLPTDNQHWVFYSEDSRKVLKKKLDKNIVFDFILHDGSHNKDVVYEDLSYIVKRMKRNAILLVHDVCHERFGKGLRKAVNNVFRKPYDCEKVILPYGSGLAIVRMKSDLGNGSVNPKWRKK